MADEEPVDKIPELREKCSQQATCQSMMKEYELDVIVYCSVLTEARDQWSQDFGKHNACSERVNAKGHGDCEPQYFDFLKCVDKCVVPSVFSFTK